MIKGVIHNNRPLVSAIIGWDFRVQEQLVVVDTGFTGELKLSVQMAAELGLTITHTKRVEYGDGRVEVTPYGTAFILLEGVTYSVSVMISSGEPVIGVELLRKFDYLLSMDFSENVVILE